MTKKYFFNSTQKELLITIVAILIYTIAAIFSKGYYHPDEHFQILEFANFKLGKTSQEDLPWEFSAQIRSSFQPWIAFISIKISHFFKIYSPYVISFVLRLMTGYFALYTIRRFVNANIHNIKKSHQTWYILLSYFLWFLPFINVRFSSETWSGLFFLYAISYINCDKKLSKYSLVKIGVLCGLSFLCRFQAAIMIGGLVLWLLLIKKDEVKNIFVILLFCIVIIWCGILLDRLFYGEWVISFWNYFDINIIKNIASRFGTTPIYTFIYQIIFNQLFFVGLIVSICFVLVLTEEPKSLLVWCIVPLFLCHIVIPHKEIRFLFPVVNFIPLLLIKGWEHIIIILKKINCSKKFISFPLTFVVLVNYTALFTSIFFAPSYGRIAITNYIYDKYNNLPMIIYSIDKEEEDPTIPFSFIRQSFYEMSSLFRSPK